MNNLDKLLAEFNGNAGASVTAIQALADALKINFPDDYVAFLGATNGGEGMIGETYLMLWPVEEIMKLNTSYQVDEFAPGLLLFGSDGGGEAFAYDTRTNPWQVVKIPFVGMDLEDVEVLSPSFEEFLECLANE
jgi:hypothetical protein